MNMSLIERSKLKRTGDYKSRRIEYDIILPLLRNSIQSGLQNHLERTGGSALDVGCGEQPFRKQLEAAGYAYISFDVGQNQAENVDYLGIIDGPLPTSLVQKGPFNFVICTEVLEHVADWAVAFQNFRQLLAPGGLLLITCPHLWPLHEEPYDFWRPTPHSLNYFANRVGLEVVDQKTTGTALDVLATVLSQLSLEGSGPKPVRWIMHKSFAVFKRIAVATFRNNMFRRVFRVHTALYLSNFCVLQKPKI